MTKENANEYLPLVQALAEGKTIQQRISHGLWIDDPNPSLAYPADCYRIKPEPRKPKDIWVNEYPDNGYSIYSCKVDALLNHRLEVVRVAVHYREVIEE